MAFTQSNLTRNVQGNMRTYSGTFTSASGDNTLTVTHGMNFLVNYHVTLGNGLVGPQNPKVTTSAGVSTVVWDNTLGASGQFHFIGR